jgi:hypothetical protein
MRREKVVRRTATLMYADSDRRSAMRRMVPLTRCASAQAVWHSQNGDLLCCGGVPAHGEALAHLRATKKASWSMWVTSRGHLSPEKAGELSGDGGDDDFLGALALGEAAKLAAKVQLGCPGSGDGLLAAVLLAPLYA